MNRPSGAADVRQGDRARLSPEPSSRPWLVMSHSEQHRALGLAIVVPLTSIDRGWETHVRMNPGAEEAEVAMCELVRSIPVSALREIDQAPFPDELVEQVHSILKTLTAPRR
jgi:mRNA-degrading endonuclease toxin of MazEF toxin-antitoxin module